MLELMEIDSKPYGKLKVSEKQLFTFNEGLLGFEKFKKYYLLDKDEGPFYWLQSVDVKEIAFIIINPMYFKTDYRLELMKQDFDDIALLTDKDIENNLLHYVIITIPPSGNPNEMTANFLGPIIINKMKKIGKQSLSLNKKYTTRHNILSDLEKVMEVK